jgi:superfamily II DNA or RNA helicase
MIIQSRWYQESGEKSIGEAFENFQSILAVAPTGAGKTIMFSSMAKKSVANGVPTIIIANRKELIDQANKKLKKLDAHPTLIVPGYRDKVSNLYLASVDTLRNRKIPDLGFAIIDECHIRTFDPIVLELKKRGVSIAGFTATPERYGKKLMDGYPKYTGQLFDVYEHMIEICKISELLRDGFLVPAVTYGAPVELDDVKIKGGDYDAEELYKKFNKSKLYAGVVDNYLKFANGKKALCFCINVEHSKKQAAEFLLRGIRAIHVDGDTPAHIRDKIFLDFSLGNYDVLCNCGICTTGYDEPTVECVIINRPTKSLTLFLQMAGRGGRTCDEIGKTHFVLIDQGSNIYTHGFWEQDREWELVHKRIKKKQDVAPIKMCDKCEALIAVSATNCKYCGVLIEKKSPANKLINAEFVLLDAKNIPISLKKSVEQMSIAELEEYRELKNFSVQWVIRFLKIKGHAALSEYAAIKNYSKAWVYKQLEIAEKEKQDAKDLIWDFVVENEHATNEMISDYANKKLKINHSPEQINFLLPKILEKAKEYRLGILQ